MARSKRYGGTRILERKARGNKVDRLIYTRWDPALQKRVVVKRYTARLAGLREARVMRRYGRNRYLVRYYRFFTRRGKAYIVMEWVPGQSLSKLIGKYGAFPPRQVATVALAILRGVASLHRAGYVHGDLHGKNVIVSDLDRPKLKIIDFQHAVRMNRSGKAKARRRLRNPPIHLAPETCRRTIDSRYDVYGVGFLMASMLLGKEPTKSWQPVQEQHGRSAAESQLWTVIRQAIHRRPTRRYRSAKRMSRAIREIEWAVDDGDGGS